MTTSSSRSTPDRQCRWCREPEAAATIASFFVAHADPAYISHSELQFGRAVSPDRWSDTLGAQIQEQARRAALNPHPGKGLHLMLVTEDDALAGLAFVSFAADNLRPFATLEDLLIAPAGRGRGLGERMLGWIEAECRALGFRRLFLESGRGNHAAHRFFERHGFVPTSVVMMREF